MQCRASRPTASASTRVRPLSSSTRWNSPGPSSGRTPVHSDVYGFMRSPVEERGRSCRKTSRSRHDGSTFSIPITVISTGGSVVHMRPLPSDSTTPTVPVSAMPKFAPETPTRARRKAWRRWRRAASVSSSGSSPSPSSPSSRANRSRISDRLRWIAGTRMCDDQSCESCTMSSARSVSIAVTPRCSSAWLRSISSVVSDLTLTTSRAPWAAHEVAHDRVGLGRVARPVHVAAGRLHRRLELLEQDVEPAHGAALDRRPGRAQLLPVGHLGHDRVALGADAARGVVQVAAQLRVVEAAGLLGTGSRGGQDLRQVQRCARRRLRAAGRRRCASGTSSRPPRTPRRAVARTLRSLSASMASDTSAFLIANVPPKPQHSWASGSSTRSMPRTRAAGAAACPRPAAPAASGRSGGR